MTILAVTEVAQVAADYGPMVAQYGFGGVLIIVVLRGFDLCVRAQERLDHTMKGLAMAIWTDLAVRPYIDEATRKRAEIAIQKMEASSTKR